MRSIATVAVLTCLTLGFILGGVFVIQGGDPDFGRQACGLLLVGSFFTIYYLLPRSNRLADIEKAKKAD